MLQSYTKIKKTLLLFSVPYLVVLEGLGVLVDLQVLVNQYQVIQVAHECLVYQVYRAHLDKDKYRCGYQISTLRGFDIFVKLTLLHKQ